jgi:LPXTG-motif cell wall-anchored protein
MRAMMRRAAMIVGGLVLGLTLTFTAGGAALAQSCSAPDCSPTGTTATTAFPQSSVLANTVSNSSGSGSLPKTGENVAVPLALAGGLIGFVLAGRSIARRRFNP